MMKFDTRHPDGIIIQPDRRKVQVAPLVTRQMTDEERERYGLVQPRPAKGTSRIAKVYYAYLDGKLSHYKQYDRPVSVCDCLHRFREV